MAWEKDGEAVKISLACEGVKLGAGCPRIVFFRVAASLWNSDDDCSIAAGDFG